MRILLLSAYDAYSHVEWRRVLTTGLPEYQWTTLVLPPRHFAWRVRGNPLTWYSESRDVLTGSYDLVLATSMVDLATLRGLVPDLGRIPNLVYFHENQFAYPPGENHHGLLEAQLSSIYSALAADKLLFNSRFNRETFARGCDALMARLPDGVPDDLSDLLLEKSEVLPVPIAASLGQVAARCASDPALRLVWNHRWEYDKNPDGLLALAQGIADRGLDCQLHVVGQQFRRRPEAFTSLQGMLQQAGMLGRWGYIEQRSEYLRLLSDSDIVLSTALHDFQGLSVLEGCALGCTPLVPDGLAYPEWISEEFRYRDTGHAVDRLASWAGQKREGRELPRQDVAALSADALLPRYRDLMEGLAA